MPIDPAQLSPGVLEFLTERHLASLTTLRRDGSPHVIAVGFTYDAPSRIARVITSDGTVKIRNAERLGPEGAPSRAAVCQVDGRRWLTLEGLASVSRDRAEITEAEQRYGTRYRTPRINPHRVVLTIAVDRILGHT